MPSALRVYEGGLANQQGVTVRLSDGTVAELALHRYLSAADETDESVLTRAVGPVLDVGCGPGRHLHALARRGVFALGVDLSNVAVELARGRGARAIVGSIFDDVPGTGSWRTALLFDGNIGIGGEPVRLLKRIGALLDDQGELLVELDAPGSATERLRARLEVAGEVTDWFGWARVALDGIDVIAARAGFRVGERWCQDRRYFARLVVVSASAPSDGRGGG